MSYAMGEGRKVTDRKVMDKEEGERPHVILGKRSPVKPK